jgi:hypothetical protein
MLKPVGRGTPRRSHWKSITDDQLLATELTTDDPLGLADLVFELPAGDEEPHVEYSYDLRGFERERLRCVHGNHPHLAGFVMNKRGKRFLVGHICGKNIYGENFELYKKDYCAARDRQDVLRRVREVTAVIDPFLRWMDEVTQSNTFALYEDVRKQFRERMGWLSNQLEWHTNNAGGELDGFKLPKTLFDGFSDAHQEFKETAAEIGKLGLLLVGKVELEKDVKVTLATMQMQLRTLDETLDQLREVADFFQPACLAAVCEAANVRDNPKKRRYELGLLTITCHRENGSTTVRMPKDYKLPNRGLIAAFRTALAGLS